MSLKNISPQGTHEDLYMKLKRIISKNILLILTIANLLTPYYSYAILEEIIESELPTKGLKNSSFTSACAKSATIIKSLPYTISASGAYTLEASLTCALCKINGPCITIKASDVSFDLGGLTLSGGATAIQVQSNIQNVIIKNGTIYDTLAEGIIVGAGCSNINIIDMKIINANQCNGSSAILFQGQPTNPIISSLIKNSTISDSKNAGIILLYTTFTSLIQNNIQSILGTDSSIATIGIMDVGGNFNRYEACNVEHVISLQPNGSAIGFSINSQSSSLFSCTATNIISLTLPNNNAFGFFINLSQYVSLENCLSISNNASLALPAGESSRAVGFLSQGSIGTSMKYCSTSNILSPDSGTGFQLSADTSSSIANCISSSNSNNGFLISNTTTNAILASNSALSNKSSGFNINQSITSGAILYNNFSARNIINYTANIAASYPVKLLGTTPADNGDNIDGV
jgi:hypothetical protein